MSHSNIEGHDVFECLECRFTCSLPEKLCGVRKRAAILAPINWLRMITTLVAYLASLMLVYIQVYIHIFELKIMEADTRRITIQDG